MTAASPARTTGQTSYDQVPYTSQPFPQTHPDRLATVAYLFGLKPKPVHQCRVLELGCASGGNLLPMAVTLPGSQFLGIDLSVRQIEQGLQAVRDLGLSNVELIQFDLMDIGPELGQFDYIICHGVYSWVPKVVREKILAICRENLTRDGVAYVSYNTYPGWHMRGMIRDMMRYHAARFSPPPDKVRQARALLDFLAEFAVDQKGPYGALLRQELEQIRDKPDAYLYHEHLEEVNEPVYFHEFARSAVAHELRYLGEAAMGTMASQLFPPKVQAKLRQVASSQIRKEQYMDFLRQRTFRQTLLVHAENLVIYRVEAERVAGLHVASPAQPAEPIALDKDDSTQFKGPGGAVLSTPDCLLKAVMQELRAVWPLSLAFEDLRQRARNRLRAAGRTLGEPNLAETSRIGSGLMSGYLGGLVELSPSAPRFICEVSERPVACPLARWQAERGNTATNRRHEQTRLDDAERQVLRRLDGTRDRAALLEEVVRMVQAGVLAAKREGQALQDPALIRESVGNALGPLLQKLARMAFLVS
jgi:methyltransferase-like protein